MKARSQYASRVMHAADRRWFDMSEASVTGWIERSGRPPQECWETLNAGGILVIGCREITRRQSAAEIADATRQLGFTETTERPGPQPVRQLKLWR